MVDIGYMSRSHMNKLHRQTLKLISYFTFLLHIIKYRRQMLHQLPKCMHQFLRQYACIQLQFCGFFLEAYCPFCWRYICLHELAVVYVVLFPFKTVGALYSMHSVCGYYGSTITCTRSCGNQLTMTRPVDITGLYRQASRPPFVNCINWVTLQNKIYVLSQGKEYIY